MPTSSVNKRIAKNTIMLYIRMLVTTIISLYTVRLTLQILGADDYGIYNAVCGVIGFLSFISATLANSAQRYLAFDLGQNDYERYEKTFSLLMSVFFLLAIFIVVIAEVVGPWLISNKLVIPDDRLTAAHWIFQFSVLSILVRFITLPYTASIVAHEKMGIYAYVSIAEVVLKLVIVYALLVSPYDKLIFYAALHFLMDFIVSAIYIIICKVKIPNCRFRFYWEKTRLKEIGSFIGWNTFGSLSGVVETQGMTIVTNMFFPPATVASRAIADRVNSVSYSFVSNFVLASSPQMVKYFSCGDTVGFNKLFYRTSYISYYLMLLITVPLILLMPDLLKLWLSDTLLEDMVFFSQLSLISALVSSLETPISRAVAATGQVKLYQVTNCIVSLLGIPICYYLFKMGLPASWGYVVFILLLLLSIAYRIVVLRKYSTISIKEYVASVIIPGAFVTAIMLAWGGGVNLISINNVWARIFIIGTASLIFASIVIFLFLPKAEKIFIVEFIRKKIKR